MKNTTQGSVSTGLIILSVPVVSFVSHFIIFPIAAWNQNFFMVLVAVFAPALYIQSLKLTGKVKVSVAPTKKNLVASIKSLIPVSIIGFVLWFHLIIPAIVVFIIYIMLTKVLKK